MSVSKSSFEPFSFSTGIGLEGQHQTFHVSSIVIPSFALDRTLSFAVQGLALPFLFPRCRIWVDAVQTRRLARFGRDWTSAACRKVGAKRARKREDRIAGSHFPSFFFRLCGAISPLGPPFPPSPCPLTAAKPLAPAAGAVAIAIRGLKGALRHRSGV